jgi:small conductance mechanosensitive channel
MAASARSLTVQTARQARRAKWELALLVPLLLLTITAYVERERFFGLDTPVRVAAAFVMVALGWALARDLGRFTAPALFRLVIGLAAQQTLGNLIAGVVLISVRPFKVGDRVRLQAGAIAGQIEGVVAALGLLYTTFARGQDSIMVPNNIVLAAAVVPLREPAAVDLRARLRPDVKPSDVQALLQEAITTPVRGEPNIALEEVDAEEVVVRIRATPLDDSDGPKLADEVLAAVGAVTQES